MGEHALMNFANSWTLRLFQEEAGGTERGVEAFRA
jgi:hypothetical protein